MLPQGQNWSHSRSTGRSGELELLVVEQELLWGADLSWGVCTCNRNREEML